MNIDILTLFPEMFKGVFKSSIIFRGQKKGLIKINIRNLRDWARDKHKAVDDAPYGGGAGMVLKVNLIDCAIASLKSRVKSLKSRVILLTPRGKTFTQRKARTLSRISNLVLICGHYEGFDERVRKLVDEEISIGNYILTGGEIPAMVLVDSISRLVPGVINPESLEHESFSTIENCKTCPELVEGLEIGNLTHEYPQYTRPEIYRPISIKTKRPLRVPEILFSGDHCRINAWRLKHRKIVK